ncbi:c-type cytochrome [Persicobacter diffluens]|uniref:Cytochrome c domain-containing protein n=1 Tax=Persicobacter diffluens TaxID=981 RepID=A0AAN4VUB8_9BACT|nr:hypothetical protein PEDI_04250 [Persicobacter diffluens]
MKNLVFGLLALMIVLVSACGGSEKKESQQKQEAPKKVAQVDPGKKAYRKAACNTCHGWDGKKGMYNSADLSQTQMTIEERIEIIRKGKGDMNAFEDVLSPQEIEAVAKYLDKL